MSPRPIPAPHRCDTPPRSRAVATGILPLLLLCCSLAAIPTQAETDRTLSVRGTAEEQVPPDMARIRGAVVVDAVDPAAARQSADQTVAGVLRDLKRLGIPDQAIDTSGLQINPQYRWDEATRSRELTGYRVLRSLEVRLLDLDRLGDLLTTLSVAGVNQLQAPVLGLAEPERVYQRVLAAAAENARARAEVLATTLRERLGPVVSASTHDTAQPTPLRRDAMMVAAEAAPADASTYQSADLSFRVHISVTFQLE